MSTRIDPYYVKLPASILKIVRWSDDTLDGYQRGFSQRFVDAKIAEFNPLKVKAIIVSLREPDPSRDEPGGYYMLDGQHTKAIQQGVYENPHVPVQCIVHEGLTYEEEALIYGAQADVKRQSSVELFRARLQAGESHEREIKRQVEAAGFKLDLTDSRSGHGVSATGSLKRAKKHFASNPLAIQDALSIYGEAWGTDFKVTGQMLDGMMMFVTKYAGQFDRAHFVKQLRLVGRETASEDIDQLIARSRVRGYLAALYVLVATYNNKKKAPNRLQPPVAELAGNEKIGE